MGRYVVRRLLAALPTLLGAATAIFLLLHLIPGDPVLAILQDHFSQETYATVQARLGLDRPLYQQYLDFFLKLGRGDLGTSFRTHEPVLRNVINVLPFTLNLAVAGFVLSLVAAIPLGIVCALRRRSAVDSIVMIGALLGVSMPSFWLGVVLLITFSVNLPWFPAAGAGNPSNLLDTLHALVLPAVAIALQTAATQARITRSSFLDVLGRDYVRTARAKGLVEWIVVTRHALRNALIPITTVAGMDLLRLLGGAAVIEIVFSRPGIGKLLVDSIAARDYPQIQGTLLVYIAAVIAVNVLTDVIYAMVDPRVSYA